MQKQLQKLNEETLERSTIVKNSEKDGKKPFRFWRIWRLRSRSKWFLPLALFFDARKLARWLTAAALTDAFANLFTTHIEENTASTILLLNSCSRSPCLAALLSL